MWPWVQSDPVPKQEQRLRENGFDGAFVRGLVVEQTDVPCTQTDGNEKRSIRFDQAPLFTQFRSALIRALASSISFRMSAVIATFGGIPTLPRA
jgi:hypothetical protein